MKRLALVLAAALAALLAALALAGPASAHVTVTAPGAVAGGSDQEITFRVPVEKDVATTAVTVALPTDTPIASVEVQADPGLDAHAEDDQAGQADQDRRRRHHPGGLADHLDGRRRQRPQAGGVRRVHDHRRAAARRHVADLQGDPDLRRRQHACSWIEVAAPGSTSQPENPAPVLTLAKSTGDTSATSPAATKAPRRRATPARSSCRSSRWCVAAGALGLRRRHPGPEPHMRLQWQAVAAGVALAVIGATGLVRGATPDSSGSAHSHTAALPTGVFPRISVSAARTCARPSRRRRSPPRTSPSSTPPTPPTG